MSDIHNLTEKEVKKIDEAASTVKKLAKYIREINGWNALLKRNLDEAIKAGDVTNEQKMRLTQREWADEQYRLLFDKIREKCPKDCECEDEKHDECPVYQELVIANWMLGVAKGNDLDWKFIFEYAMVGRKEFMEKYNKCKRRPT